MTAIAEEIELGSVIKRLDKDTRKAATILTDREARYLVDLYYQHQDNRIRSDGQVRAMSGSGEPHAAIVWLSTQNSTLESRVKSLLDIYSNSRQIGVWARGICGIGPVLSSGLMAHIDITRAPTAGHIWRFAGLDPTTKWEKKTKRPWNAELKKLCWKIGESFVHVQGNEKDVYGAVFAGRKAEERRHNEAGSFADQAAAALAAKNFKKDTKAREFYEKGLLPPAHIHARARRYAVKLFLSHWHEKAYEFHFGTKPPLPYPIAFGGHAHYIAPPE
jgi:hypothetical protein